MIYNNIDSIDIPFLHNVALSLSKKYSLYNIYMDKTGGISITFNSKLSEDDVKDILQAITPHSNSKDYSEPSYNLDYSYSNDMQKTYIYSADGIDYRKIA